MLKHNLKMNSKISLGTLRWPKLAKEVLKEALGALQMSQKCWVVDVSHFHDFIVFSVFAWEGVLIFDICGFRVFAKTTFLIERSYQKSMFGRIFPHFLWPDTFRRSIAVMLVKHQNQGSTHTQNTLKTMTPKCSMSLFSHNRSYDVEGCEVFSSNTCM